MSSKWSIQEDQKLIKLVQKHGTNWAGVLKYFRNSRTRTSIIKRWHGKLKFQVQNEKKTGQKTERQQQKNKNQQISQQNKNIKFPVKTKPIFSHKAAQRQNRRQRYSSKVPNRKVVLTIQQPVQKKILNINTCNKFQREKLFLIGLKPRGGRIQKPKESKQKIHAVSSRAIQLSFSEVQRQLNQDIYQFKKLWTNSQDQKLCSLVLQQGVLRWEKLAQIMDCEQQQVRQRWKRFTYEQIKLDDKVGGSVKYSNKEDSILVMGYRNGMTWSHLSSFLPGRSQFSIEARWRRIIKPELELQLRQNSHYLRRQFLKKIVQKNKTLKEEFTMAEEKKDKLEGMGDQGQHK